MHSLQFTEIPAREVTPFAVPVSTVARERPTSSQPFADGHPMTMDPATLQAAFEPVAADYVKRLRLAVTAVRPGEVDISLPVAAELVHGGGVVCGQALMAAADSAMVLAMIADLGEFRPMTTVQLQTSFIRPIPGDAGEAMLTARVLRRGRSLSFGEIVVRTADGKLAAQATTTYALL
jgi:uncharacterized protein (TIGR00369 family)